MLYMKQRRHALAVRHVERAGEILTRQLGARHPKTRAVVANLQALREARPSIRPTRGAIARDRST
jgi:hypothetical protein